MLRICGYASRCGLCPPLKALILLTLYFLNVLYQPLTYILFKTLLLLLCSIMLDSYITYHMCILCNIN